MFDTFTQKFPRDYTAAYTSKFIPQKWIYILCNDSTGCKEAGDNTNTDAYTMINVPYECYLDKDWF